MQEFDWAQRFAEILERNIAYLPIEQFSPANDLLRLYRSGITPLQGEVSLRDLIEAAASNANAEGKDPYREILRAIASRSHQWVNHVDAERSVDDDIKAWLEYEASRGEEADK